LNLELSKKTKLVEDLKQNLVAFTSKRKDGIKNDEDMLDYLANVIKEKEKIFEEMQFKI